jgi:predicted CoA-binding protein
VDKVTVFRAAREIPRTCADILSPPSRGVVWMQLGIRHDEVDEE